MKKARFFKYFFSISLIVVLLFAVSAVLVYHYFPKDKILSLITSSAEQSLKRKVTVRGVDYGLQGITLRDISIYNKLYSDNEIPDDLIASVKEAKIYFSLLPLLQKEFIVSKITLDNLKIIISFAKGKSNLGSFLQDLKTGGESDIKARISSIGFKDAEITLKDPIDVLKPLEGRYFFNGTVNISGHDMLSVSGCDIVLPDQRGAISSDKVIISLPENNFEITGDYKLRNCSLLWVYTWADDLSLPYTNFTGDIKNLKISKDQVEGYAKGKSVLSNSMIVNADGICRVDIIKETVSLIDITGEIQKSRFFINQILLSFSSKVKDALLKFNITGIDADINDLKGILTFLPDNLLPNIFGDLSGDLSFENKFYNGLLNFRNVVYRSDGKDIIKINSEIPVKNNIIHKEKVPVSIFDQRCLVSVSTSGNNFQKVILNVYSKEFKYLIRKVKNTGEAFSRLKIKSDFIGRIDCDNFFLNRYNFSDVVINYSFIEGKLNLNQAVANFMGGAVKGNGYIDVSGQDPYVDLLFNFDDIKIQNIAGLKEELSGRFFGVAKGNVDIEFGIDKDSSIFDSLKGKVEFNIDKGKLVNTGIQKGLGIWLSELKYKLSNIEFSKIYGNLNVIGDNIYINSMLFIAPDIRLKMDGYVLRPELNDMKIPGELKIDLEFNDFFIQDIPNLPQAQFISKLLKIPALKKKGDWYVMSFRDKGDDITYSKNIKPL
ncbi:MAG: AsmA family protein [Spirochaetes bacterium]|nr:AsmA family protein [Spirochaetota bacterium]